MSSDDKIQRSSLPIPDIQHPGLITYDAKDPDAKSPRSGTCARRRARQTSWSS